MKKLRHVEEAFEQWLLLQKQWTYLENIFNSDIGKELEKEQIKFKSIDTDWKARMKKFSENPLFFTVITSAQAMKKDKGKLVNKDNIVQNFRIFNNTLDEI